MSFEIGGIYFYDGRDEASSMKAQNVRLDIIDAFGFEGEVLVSSLDGSSPTSQMVSIKHLSSSSEEATSVTSSSDELDQLTSLFEGETTDIKTKGDIKMDFTTLKSGDKVKMTEVSLGDMIMVGLEVGDIVTVIAGVGELIPPNDLLNEDVVGTINEDPVAIGITDRGTPALLGDDNSFEKLD